MNDRVILHCDCNNFFASVELREHPELADKPVAVAGDPKERSGIILAKNMIAKKSGVRTAETIWQAKQKCPELVLLPPHHEKYSAVSREINSIYQSVTDQVEPFSIDESWLDVTGSQMLFGSGREIADMLRDRVRCEIGITISVGVSDNKIWAKLGSDYKKPDATTVITRENVKSILYPLPVGDMLFVGKNSEEILRSRGIDTIGKLISTPMETIVNLLGKSGEDLWKNAAGMNDSPVRVFGDEDPAKSISCGNTFPKDLVGEEEFRQGLMQLCETVGARLRKNHQKCSTVTVHIKDARLKTVSRQKTLPYPTNMTKQIFQTACSIVKASWNANVPVRQFTVAATNLCDEGDTIPSQINFLDEKTCDDPRQVSFEKTVDLVRRKFGKDAIAPGRIGKKRESDDHD